MSASHLQLVAAESITPEGPESGPSFATAAHNLRRLQEQLQSEGRFLEASICVEAHLYHVGLLRELGDLTALVQQLEAEAASRDEVTGATGPMETAQADGQTRVQLSLAFDIPRMSGSPAEVVVAEPVAIRALVKQYGWQHLGADRLVRSCSQRFRVVPTSPAVPDRELSNQLEPTSDVTPHDRSTAAVPA